MATFVEHLGREEDLGETVGCDRDESARTFKRGGLADAVVAEHGDQPLALLGRARPVDQARAMSPGEAGQVAAHSLEPELERVHFLEEAVVVEVVDVDRDGRVRGDRQHGDHGRTGVWYSTPIRPSRVLNSLRTVSARTPSICSGESSPRSTPW